MVRRPPDEAGESGSAPVEQAQQYTSHAEWLVANDRSSEALDYSYHAVSLWRQAVAMPGPDHMPALALGLVDLSRRFADRQRASEALGYAEEAVSLWRQLAEGDAVSHRRGLARALVNVSQRLRDSGRWSEALASGEEAVSILRRVAMDDVVPG